MDIAIIGYGCVGKNMGKLFTEAIVYDPILNIGTQAEVNRCALSFICVPTPEMENGTCDISIVEDILNWNRSTYVVLRSTVSVGTTEYLAQKYDRHIVYQPEYYGETVDHPYADPQCVDWITLGGEEEDCEVVIEAYQKVRSSQLRIYTAPTRTVEFAKYMENAFLATKVIFSNEMYDIACALGVCFSKARELWLADPRMGRSHTFVYKDNRGFGGKCLPKDLNALRNTAKQVGVETHLLNAVAEKNRLYHKTKFDSNN